MDQYEDAGDIERRKLENKETSKIESEMRDLNRKDQYKAPIFECEIKEQFVLHIDV